MSRYPLREIAERLAGANELETVLDALLAYFHALQGNWNASIAFYDPERGVFDKLYVREHGRMQRRDLVVSLEQLPARLVRKFVRPSAFFNGDGRRALLEKLFQTSPAYQPDRFEAAQIAALGPPVGWRSCVVLPLNDRDDLLGIIVLTDTRETAFPAAAIEDLQPLRSLASLAIARRMHVTGRPTPEVRSSEETARRTSAALQVRIHQLEDEIATLQESARARDASFEALRREADALRHEVAMFDGERHAAMRMTAALEEQVAGAGAQIEDACAQLGLAQTRLAELENTLEFIRDAFDAMAGSTDTTSLTRAFVAWFCDHFQADRCSLMRLDDGGAQLRILAHRGLDPMLAGRVRVPMGSGVSGWVASHRQPVLMREADDETPVRPTGLETYASDSFLSVPLVHRNRVMGVLNLSNRRDGQPFEALDLERAQLAGHVLAMALDSPEAAVPRRAAA